MGTHISESLIAAARSLSESLHGLVFQNVHVYNPLEYAWNSHKTYLKLYAQFEKRFVLIGMNPGPFGMMQTGIPFGQIAAVRDWMRIQLPINKPEFEHPKRPIEGFACTRSEVSGARLWGWAAQRFGSAEQFFSQGIVLNYCPLVFLEHSGKNRTPDKLLIQEQSALRDICDKHLQDVLLILSPSWAIGVGNYAENRLKAIQSKLPEKTQISRIPHPSPANPAANRGWCKLVDDHLSAIGLL